MTGLKQRWTEFFNSYGIPWEEDTNGLFLPWFRARIKIVSGWSDQVKNECNHMIKTSEDEVILCIGDPLDYDMKLFCHRRHSSEGFKLRLLEGAHNDLGGTSKHQISMCVELWNATYFYPDLTEEVTCYRCDPLALFIANEGNRPPYPWTILNDEPIWDVKRKEQKHSKASLKMTYSEYLKSKLWQEKRLQRLKMDGFQCVICGSAKNLNIHHITYEHLYEEPMEDLITVCKTCHETLHANDIK